MNKPKLNTQGLKGAERAAAIANILSEAAKTGRKVEYICSKTPEGDNWDPSCSAADFLDGSIENFPSSDDWDYRLRPKDREVFINYYVDNSGLAKIGSPQPALDAAREAKAVNWKYVRTEKHTITSDPNVPTKVEIVNL